MKSIGSNIARDACKLSCVKISNLELKAESLSGICLGLQQSKSVKELYIQNCGLTAETIERGMLEYMQKIKSLILLDLSFN
jgi:Ran GTPase-activating protein (RanGAP) involved in mRNA processing and transport